MKEKLVYSLPHKNPRNPLMSLHLCITAPRLNYRSKGEHHALQTRIFVPVILSLSRSEGHAFRFKELKSLFVTTLTRRWRICCFDVGETHTRSIVFVIRRTYKCNLKPQRAVRSLPLFGGKHRWKPLKRDTSTSRDLVARLRALRPKKLAPLAKKLVRSTFSKYIIQPCVVFRPEFCSFKKKSIVRSEKIVLYST